MLLILARHGNTFNLDEKPYRVGKRNDLALVQSGINQAHAFANSLLEKKIIPAAIYCSPLQRTKKFSEIITQTLNLQLKHSVDERLNELDYGAWAGLTDEEVKTKFGTDLENWEKCGIWPKNSQWPETEHGVIQQVKTFAKDLTQVYKPEDVIVAVSSSGKLRYFLKLINKEFEYHIKTTGVKVKTGNACVIAFTEGKFELIAWNVKPEEL
jgi:probable phosphoglycerate mutase